MRNEPWMNRAESLTALQEQYETERKDGALNLNLPTNVPEFRRDSTLDMDGFQSMLNSNKDMQIVAANS